METTILSSGNFNNTLLIVLCLIFGLVIGTVLGYFIRVKSHEKSFAKTKAEAEKIIAMAEEEATKKKKESISKDELKAKLVDSLSDIIDDAIEKGDVESLIKAINELKKN